jgi:hypothetical protein
MFGVFGMLEIMSFSTMEVRDGRYSGGIKKVVLELESC